MSYSNTRPNPLSSPALDVQQTQDNFAAIQAALLINHVDFNLSDQGKHNFIQFPNLTLSASIPAATAATEFALYSTSSGLFLRPPSQTAGTVTNDKNISNTFSSSTLSANGYCYLPCGAKMAWGSVSATHGTTTTFSFSSISGFPGFSGTPFSVQITGEGTSGTSAVFYTSLSSTSVGVYNASGTTRTCKILVIGL